ncbi:MAG: DNA gyrase subunit A [Anaerolineales bacterium]|nr:DNA gyrase subunit A [Anaerolineales bacterium]
MEIGQIRSVDIELQMRDAYLDYAMSVIVARALPDARDGLKPVHRRILYAMHDMGLRASGPHKKSARIVGEVLGKYHPHGDTAVYDAMARMAQDFSMRYMLVDGQGNFGSVDGDPPAAMRYTEARLARTAEEMLLDIDKNTVTFIDNFDGSLQEPEVLPAKLPNLLLNGTSGIAVGMATNIPPHNLGELSDAIRYLIDHYDTIDDVTVEELMRFVKGPDFPTGGLIIGSEGILSAYATGRGRIVMRAAAHIEEMGGNRSRIVVTEIPFQVNKAALIERIADLVREDRLDQISDLRDESDRRGMSIIIELKRGAQPRKVLNQLFKYTALQSTFGVQLLALVADESGRSEPRTLTLKRALQIYIEHRRVVITRRVEHDLARARARAHVLEGLLIALANLEAVIRTIRESADADAARANLMTRFRLTEAQAQAILDLQLRRLAALERQKIQEEHAELLKTIAHYEDLLANPKKILALIQDDMRDLVTKFGDERRTRIVHDAAEDLRDEDLVPDEAVLISVTARGYVKRVAAKEYRTQGRGGRGVTGQSLRGEDEVLYLLPARSLDTILFFSDKGKVYSEKVYQLPDAGRADKGVPLTNVLSISSGEAITAALPVPNFDDSSYCVMVTRHGRIKRVALSEFAAVRPSGLIAANLEEGDVLGWAKLTDGTREIILITEQGQALRYSERAVRAMGRQAAGVTAIRLDDGDFVTSVDVFDEACDLLVVTRNGFGKRTPLVEYAPKGRATGGVATIAQRSLPITGAIVAARVVHPDDEITVITTAGQALRLKVKHIRQAGRATMGTRLINLKEGDTVASVARLAAKDLAPAAVEPGDGAGPPAPDAVALSANGSGPEDGAAANGDR